jgi:hypothetical protein
MMHSTGDPLSSAQRAKVVETLERLLASPAFRKSEQCQKFLRFVVEQSLAGEEERLRERNIGIEVFARRPDYDSAEDPVVRVRATEVRKRLAQYYGETPQSGDVRIEIPSGSYRAEFHWPAAPAPPVEPPTPRRPQARRIRLAVILTVFLLSAIAAAVFWKRPTAAPDALDRFWAPVLDSGKPVFLYCGQPVVYFLSRDVHQKYRPALPPDQQRGSYALRLSESDTVKGSDIIPVTDQFVGIGNAHSAAVLAAMFATRHKTVEIRYANDLSFSDLRSAPSVLIGAFSNLWTLEMQDGLRYVFEQKDGLRRIRDRAGDRTWQLPDQAPDGKTPGDYAIVSRLVNASTGQPLILAAGITQYGTRSAGEFLTSPALLAPAMQSLSTEWPKKNVQVLLQTVVYRGTPATPRVIATHTW